MLLVSFIFVLFKLELKDNKSIYDVSNNSFLLQVKSYNYTDYKLKVAFKGKEDLVGTYYIESPDSYEYLKNNLEYGDLVLVKGKLNVPNKNTVPKAFNYKGYLNSKNIFYTLNIESIEIRKKHSGLVNSLKNIINKRIDNVDYKGYCRAFILGDKSNIAKDIYYNYQKIGIAHLFSLSGMHVGLISALLLLLLKRANVIWKYLFCDALLVIYGFIVSFPFSILRCILFFIINSFNKIFELELSSLQVLIIVFSIICFINYQAILDVGFWYSICTVLGIIVCKEFITDKNKLKEMIKLSLVAFLFSLPISLFSFYEVNVLSVIYNLFFIPLVSMIIYPLCLLSFVFSFCSFLFEYAVDLLELISSFLSSINCFSLYLDFNIWEIICSYLLLLLMFRYRMYWIGFIIIFIIVVDLTIPYFDDSSYVTFLDVNQGDASLIISKNRQDIVLIDTGGLENSNAFDVSDDYIRYLKSLGIRTIDILIITHGDYDHMGEAINIINNFNVRKVILNCGSYNDLEEKLIKVLEKKKIKYYSCIRELNISHNKFYFLNTKEYDNENDNSNVIYTVFDGYKFMFMGDASSTVEKEIRAKYNLPDIDVLKVGHHGSKTSSSKEFINEIKPNYSIISVGKNNRYGHPNKEVLDNLKKSKIYRTDFNGSILFKAKNNKLYIETFSP